MSVPRQICVVFDLDDTLYLESEYVRSGFGAIDTYLSSQGIEGFFERAWRAFNDGVRGNTFNLVLKDLLDNEPDSALVSHLVSLYRSHPPVIELPQDSKDALIALVEKDHALALLTDGPIESQRAKVRALELHQWIETVLFTREFGVEKPSPAPFQAVRDRITAASSGSEFVYVGDNPKKDFVTPRALGWRTIRVRRRGGLHSGKGVESGSVDYELRDLADLCGVLSRFEE